MDVFVVVGEGHLDPDPLAMVVRREGVDHLVGAADVRVDAADLPLPLVGVIRGWSARPGL